MTKINEIVGSFANWQITKWGYLGRGMKRGYVFIKKGIKQRKHIKRDFNKNYHRWGTFWRELGEILNCFCVFVFY